MRRITSFAIVLSLLGLIAAQCAMACTVDVKPMHDCCRRSAGHDPCHKPETPEPCSIDLANAKLSVPPDSLGLVAIAIPVAIPFEPAAPDAPVVHALVPDPSGGLYLSNRTLRI